VEKSLRQQKAKKMRLTQEQIDDSIEKWHQSDSRVELYKYLGWSWEDYQMWVLDPTYIPESKDNEV
jgi:hypothetical protein